MIVLSTRKPISFVAIVAVSLAACADQPDPSSDEEAAASQVSSPLPFVPASAFSEANASFAGVGGLGVGTIGTTGTTNTIGTSVGGGGTVGVGPNGFSSTFGTGPISTGTSFSTGPVGFSTGPITMTSGFDSGPITMTTGGTMSISSGSGAAPVITTTCTGFGCP